MTQMDAALTLEQKPHPQPPRSGGLDAHSSLKDEGDQYGKLFMGETIPWWLRQ